MAKTEQITLGGTVYTVPRLNIGELEDLTEAVTNTVPHKVAFAILSIALRRADPKPPEDLRSVETDGPEIAEALGKIMNLAGLGTANPPLPLATPQQNPAS